LEMKAPTMQLRFKTRTFMGSLRLFDPIVLQVIQYLNRKIRLQEPLLATS
jgi:hypothetical protein